MFRHSCAPGTGPDRYLCPLIGGRYLENGSTVSYKTYMDCFGQANLQGQQWLGVPPLAGGSALVSAAWVLASAQAWGQIHTRSGHLR